jgi:hypothetical protein
MDFILDNLGLILICLAAGAIPVVIILGTLKRIRKKREVNAEKIDRKKHSKTDLYHNLKSVNEERVENKEGISKTNN